MNDSNRMLRNRFDPAIAFFSCRLAGSKDAARLIGGTGGPKPSTTI